MLLVLLGSLGVLSFHWAGCVRSAERAACGYWLCCFLLVAASAAAVVAESLARASLMPLGLFLGILFIGMLWEAPNPEAG